MPPDPGKSPQSAEQRPTDPFTRPDSSDEDFDDEEDEEMDPATSGYQPLPTATPADQQEPDACPHDQDEDSGTASRAVDHIRIHMMPIDDVPDDDGCKVVATSDHVAESFQLSKGKLKHLQFVPKLVQLI